NTCRWRVLGNAVDVRVSKERAKIITALNEADAPITIPALLEATGMKRNALDLMLGRMAADGKIKRVGKGLYAHKDYVPPQTDPPPKSAGKKKPRKPAIPAETAQTDCETEAPSTQTPQTEGENTTICPSVASVRESTDTMSASPEEN